MPRIHRIDVGDVIYHTINRANARLKIFNTDEDYKLFETVLEEAQEKFAMRILAYCIMPNHWHLVLYPKTDGDLQVDLTKSDFVSIMNNTFYSKITSCTSCRLPSCIHVIISFLENGVRRKRGQEPFQEHRGMIVSSSNPPRFNLGGFSGSSYEVGLRKYSCSYEVGLRKYSS